MMSGIRSSQFQCSLIPMTPDQRGADSIPSRLCIERGSVRVPGTSSPPLIYVGDGDHPDHAARSPRTSDADPVRLQILLVALSVVHTRAHHTDMRQGQRGYPGSMTINKVVFWRRGASSTPLPVVRTLSTPAKMALLGWLHASVEASISRVRPPRKRNRRLYKCLSWV
jgi:hypothetical protein